MIGNRTECRTSIPDKDKAKTLTDDASHSENYLTFQHLNPSPESVSQS